MARIPRNYFSTLHCRPVQELTTRDVYPVVYTVIYCDNENDFPLVLQPTLAEVQSRDAWIRREETQSVLGTLRDSRSSERSLRGRRLDLQLGHGTQIERYPAKSQNSEYLSIACMKTYDL